MVVPHQRHGGLATNEHRSMTNYIEYVLIRHLEEVEKEQGEIHAEPTDE